MRMKKTINKITLIIILLIGIALVPNVTKAGLQANKGGAKVRKIPNDWLTEISDMETRNIR